MIYIENTMVKTAKSEIYLGNAGSILLTKAGRHSGFWDSVKVLGIRRQDAGNGSVSSFNLAGTIIEIDEANLTKEERTKSAAVLREIVKRLEE